MDLRSADRRARHFPRRTVCLAVAVSVFGSVALAAVRSVAQTEPTEDLDAYRGVTITDVRLQGNHVTKDAVIAREIWSDIGEPLDPELVREDVIRLENLSIFGSVAVTASPDRDGVALNFTFIEMPWLIPYPALSYNEQNGFSVGLGVASPNFLGYDITLATSVLAGGTTTFNFSALHPWIFGNHVSAEVRAWHKVRENVLLDFEETSDRAQLIGGTYLGNYGRLYGGVSYYGVGSDTDGVTLSPDNHDDMLAFGASIGYDNRDSWRVPHDGWHNEVAIVYFGGDPNFVAFDVDVRRYQPLGKRQTLATGPFLALQSGRVGTDIPSYMQYFLGGANSIRGYRVEELGKELYGKHQLIYTLEYRFLLSPLRAYKIFKWSIGMGFELAAFGDVGVAWSRGQDFSLDRARAGFGAGFRVLLPSIEAVRFDVGVSEYGDVVFNFGVNSIFTARRERVR
jgi:outer membrane protein insertion porin family